MAVQIKVLGPGCMNCTTLEANVKEAVQQLGTDAQIEKVTDYGAILAHGIMRTPGLMINGEIKVFGRVATTEEIKGFLAGTPC